MSRMTCFTEEKDLFEFAKKAAEDFKKYPEHCTFGYVTPGSFFALRWGVGADCVLVIKLDEMFEPVNFQQAIKEVE